MTFTDQIESLKTRKDELSNQISSLYVETTRLNKELAIVNKGISSLEKLEGQLNEQPVISN
ncbi:MULTISPECIES: hypothetical protein [unclassified Dehalobacter]|uniref:hypothetical protein n=1 Tax=unclassified Dehalobacter TaxID=2635733 RepID=UPI0003A891A9|nr:MULTISPECIES: hypothetical protein [unclassified Dehalobacter]RJE47707.1 hypothetical protein A7K50_03400 [Dehalobacter sp. MCB1]TCX53798.1 hypothetical protein C1I36_03445 [Dehalobacter sp. 14DCB1]